MLKVSKRKTISQPSPPHDIVFIEKMFIPDTYESNGKKTRHRSKVTDLS